MKKGFTLVELLVVVALIAAIVIVVVLTLNPVLLFQQERDAVRVSDMNTLNKAISLYYSSAMSNPSTLFMGSSSVVYVSVPDPSATSTAGDQCQGLGLPALPPGDTYQCAASSTYAKVNGTGWIPINFNSYATGNVISKLPVDPMNQTSTDLYYTYSTDGSSNYEVTSIFESQKYKIQFGQDPLVINYPEVDAKGSSISISPLFNPSGLVGWWPLDEGSGTTAFDDSGGGFNGTWQGTPAGNSGYYSTGGKVGAYAGAFNESNDAVNLGGPTSIELTGALSIATWIDPTGGTYEGIMGDSEAISHQPLPDTYQGYFLAIGNGTILFSLEYTTGQSDLYLSNSYITPGSWEFLTATYDGSSIMSLYVNGVLAATSTATAPQTATNAYIGDVGQNGWGPFNGTISDVRVYNRALSAAEVLALYNAEK